MIPAFYRTHLQSIDAVRGEASRHRRHMAAMRLNILAGSFAPYVWAFASPRYKQPEVRAKVLSWVTSSPNIMQALCDLACKVYKRPPQREIDGAKVSVQDAYRKVLKESRWRVRAKAVERRVYASNVVIVLPVVRQGRLGPELHYDSILAHAADIEPDPSNPWGSPRSVCFELPSPDRSPGGPHRASIIDENAQYFYEDGKKTKTIEHGAGVFPGVAFRLREPPALDDWWDSSRGEVVVQHQMTSAHLAARMRYVRHGQDRKKEFAISEAMDRLPFQVAGAEGAVEFSVQPGDFNYIVADTITSIDEFVSQIRFDVREAARGMGFPPDLVDFEPGTEGIESLVAAQHHATLADIRDDAIDWYSDGEHELSYKTALVLRGAGHPAASKLDPQEVYDRFRIAFPDLTFVEHPEVRLRISKAKIDLGLSSTVREYAAMHDLPPDKAREEVEAIAREEIEIGSMFAEHNVPRVADDRKANLAQLQGRIGGMASGETRQDNADNDNASSPGRGEQPTSGRSGKRDERKQQRRK